MGPVLVNDVQAKALDPVPLAGLIQSDAVNVFVVEEPIPDPAIDLNGDVDLTDSVVTLQERVTGVIDRIGISGPDGTAVGRAVVQVRDGQFTFPAVSTERGILAFLEPEPLQGNVDTNGNGTIVDTILRVFRRAGGELSAGNALTADAAPVIGGRSLTVSGGLVFYRASEPAAARQTTELLSRFARADDDDFGRTASYPILSRDGSLATFLRATETSPEQLYSVDIRRGRRRRVGGDEVLSESAAVITGRQLVESTFSDVVAIDLDTGETTNVTQNEDPDVFYGSLDASESGRFIVVLRFRESPEVVLLDRDPDADGVLDEAGADATTTTVLVQDYGEAEPNGLGNAPAISDDGRFVAFLYEFDDLVPGDINGLPDIVVFDRESETFELASVGTGGGPSTSFPIQISMSADGRFVSFSGSIGPNAGLFVRDRATDTTRRVDVASDGTPDEGDTLSPTMSADGRYVAFSSVFSPTLDPPFAEGGHVYLHDRITGLTQRVSVAADGSEANGFSGFMFMFNYFGYTPIAISGDGFEIAFASEATNLVAGRNGDNTAGQDVYIRRPDRRDAAADLTGDGDVDDLVLAAFDANASTEPAILGPATVAEVAGRTAAFLRPERAGAPGRAAGVDLNGDKDTYDEVVHISTDGEPGRNLGCAATSLALSDRLLAALVSEDGEARDFNGDGDHDDEVLFVRAAAAPGPVSCGGAGWMNTRMAGDRVSAFGDIVVLRTPETAQRVDLNRDGDRNDHVLQVFQGEQALPTFVGPAVSDFVIGGTPGREIVAFRASESNERRSDLNGDGDADDDVMQVYDAGSDTPVNLQQAAIACPLEACDPRVPYRVGTDTVTFIVSERAQQQDLNLDDDTTDVILQTVNVRVAVRRSSGATATHVLGAASGGVCTTTGTACATDEECGAGRCFVPPGGCLVNLELECDPNPEVSDCPDEITTFCVPTLGMPGVGTCFQSLSLPCGQDADCRDLAAGGDPAAFCDVAGQAFQRLANPLATAGDADGGGAKVFVGAGHCIEDRGIACDPTAGAGLPGSCEAGGQCERDAGGGATCRREVAVCTTSDDCPGQTQCRPDLLTVTAADSDRDEIPDVFDNCPRASNVLQEDVDGDAVGDLCDQPAVTCTAMQSVSAARCRLQQLMDEIASLPLGERLRTTLLAVAGRAFARLADDSDSRRRTLGRARHSLSSLRSRLRGGPARREIPDNVRAGLLARATALRDEVAALRIRPR